MGREKLFCLRGYANHHEDFVEIWKFRVSLVRALKEIRNVFLETREKGNLSIQWPKA